MKFLVTGATGFLGGALTERLALNPENKILAIGRNRERGAALTLQFENVHFSSVDLSDEPKVIAACKGIDIVFHCGALSSPWGAPSAFHTTNSLGTQYILNGCRQHLVERLIYVSSPSIYAHKEALNIPEDAPFSRRPLNEYIRSKIDAEMRVQSDTTVNSITLRPRAIFGVGDQALFPRIIRANRNGRFPLIGSNDPLIDCSYIDNVVNALILSSQASSDCFGKAYNISNDQPILRSQLLEKLFHYTQLPYHPRSIPYPIAYGIASALEIKSKLLTRGEHEPIFTRYTVNALSKSQTLDNSAAKKDLHYAPRISIDEGLQIFGTWWTAHHASNVTG